MPVSIDWTVLGTLPRSTCNSFLLEIRGHLINMQTGLEAFQQALHELYEKLQGYSLKMKKQYISDLRGVPEVDRSQVQEFYLGMLERFQSSVLGIVTNLSFVKPVMEELFGLFHMDPTQLLAIDSDVLDRVIEGKDIFDCDSCDDTVLAQLNEAWARAADFRNASSLDMMLLAGQLVTMFSDGIISEDELRAIGMELGFEDVRWDSDVNQVTSINFLAASAHVIAYFDENANTLATPGNVVRSGVDIFRAYIGEDGEITVRLGAQREAGDENDFPSEQDKGAVPLPSAGEDVGRIDQAFYEIRLGSNVSIATIVHELGHQLDRFFVLGISDQNRAQSRGMTGIAKYFIEFDAPDIIELYIPGNKSQNNVLADRANFSESNAEIFADYFMTDVLQNYELRVAERRLNDENQEYIPNPVDWVNTELARGIDLALSHYLFSLLNSGNNRRTTP